MNYGFWKKRPGRGSPPGLGPCLGFTLIELLIAVAIIAILAVIAVVNYQDAVERSLKSADAANLKTIASGLQMYFTDHRTLPPADREAGPFSSSSPHYMNIGNGPAAGGSWDGLPWVLYEKQYVTRWETLFCPKYLRQFKTGLTIRGGFPRYHNFRYAYNSAGLSSGGHGGGSGIMTGTKWIARDLYLPPQSGWYGGAYPQYPADYDYPWKSRDGEKTELVIYADFGVKSVLGGTDSVVQ